MDVAGETGKPAKRELSGIRGISNGYNDERNRIDQGAKPIRGVEIVIGEV